MTCHEDYELLVDAVMEMMARKWTKSMIKAQLRDDFKGIKLAAMRQIIRDAKAKIQKLYGIDPQEYKGRQISFYEYVIRTKSKMSDKLTAAERLDKLFGLEHIQGDDPEIQARRIREQLIEMESTMGVGGPDNGGSSNEGESQVDTKKDAREPNSSDNKQQTNNNSKEIDLEAEDSITSNNIPSEVLDILKNIKDEEIKDFKKRRSNKELE
jgi:hypothetical protein